MMSMLATSCEEEIDNTASRNQSEIELTPSGEYIKLDESKPNETAFTLKWSTAHNFGEDYITLINMRCSLSVAMLQISRNLMMMVNFFARTPTKRCRIYWSITSV